MLHTLIGYTAQPTGVQLVFYLTTLIVIGGLMRLVGNATPPPAPAPARPPADNRLPRGTDSPVRWFVPRRRDPVGCTCALFAF